VDGSQAPQGMPRGGFPQGGPPGGFAGGMRGGRGGLFLFGPYGGMIGVALLVLTYAVLAFAFWQFLKKAGLTPVLALLMLVPVVNLGVALWAAFTDWPVLREVARLKELVATYELRAADAARAGADVPTPSTPT
jgi:hypothetical protein